MSDVRHSSFKRTLPLILVLTATTLLGGCSQTTGNLFTNLADKKNSKPTEIAVQEDTKPVKTDEIKVAGINTKAKPNKWETVGKEFKIDQTSQWCRYLKNNALAEAEIIGSPTLSANSDENGNGSFNIGMNLLDLKKAELTRQSGAVKCKAYMASKSIEATMRLAGESSKFAASYTKYTYLSGQKNQMNAIVTKARNLVNARVLTLQQANSIAIKRDELISQLHLAKSEADKRKDIPAIDSASIIGSNGQLKDATYQMQAIDREIRTIGAYDVSVQAGYRFNDGEALTSDNDNYYAKIKLGIRLGALTQRRSHFEDEAEEARINALSEQNYGPAWKSDFAASAVTKSLIGLKNARKAAQNAKASADSTAARLNSSERPEVIFAALQAKLSRIELGAQLAALNASINEMENSKAKLNSLNQ